MTKHILIAMILGLLSIPDSASGSEPAATTASAEPEAGAGSATEKLICRRDSVVGSRVQKRRTCKTRLEWAKDNEQLRDGWGEFMRRANGAAPNN